MESNGYSHPSVLEHVGDIVERFGVREVIGQAMTVDRIHWFYHSIRNGQQWKLEEKRVER